MLMKYLLISVTVKPGCSPGCADSVAGYETCGVQEGKVS